MVQALGYFNGRAFWSNVRLNDWKAERSDPFDKLSTLGYHSCALGKPILKK